MSGINVQSPRSHALAICSDRVPDTISKVIAIEELPFAAREFHNGRSNSINSLTTKDERLRKCAEELLLLITYLKLECRFRPDGNKRFLPHMLRVKDGANISIDQLASNRSKEAKTRFLLALDSLIMLAVIPDILTSPIASKVFLLNQDLSAIISQKPDYSASSLDESMARLFKYSWSFHRRFDYIQQGSREMGRILILDQRRKKWLAMLRRFWAGRDHWRVPAARAAFKLTFPEDSFRAKEDTETYKDEFKDLKRNVLKYYARELKLKTLELS